MRLGYLVWMIPCMVFACASKTPLNYSTTDAAETSSSVSSCSATNQMDKGCLVSCGRGEVAICIDSSDRTEPICRCSQGNGIDLACKYSTNRAAASTRCRSTCRSRSGACLLTLNAERRKSAARAKPTARSGHTDLSGPHQHHTASVDILSAAPRAALILPSCC